MERTYRNKVMMMELLTHHQNHDHDKGKIQFETTGPELAKTNQLSLDNTNHRRHKKPHDEMLPPAALPSEKQLPLESMSIHQDLPKPKHHGKHRGKHAIKHRNKPPPPKSLEFESMSMLEHPPTPKHHEKNQEQLHPPELPSLESSTLEAKDKINDHKKKKGMRAHVKAKDHTKKLDAEGHTH